MQIDENCYTVEILYKKDATQFFEDFITRLECEILTYWKSPPAQLLGVSVGRKSITMLFDNVDDPPSVLVTAIDNCAHLTNVFYGKMASFPVDITRMYPASRSFINQFGARATDLDSITADEHLYRELVKLSAARVGRKRRRNK